MRKLLKIKKVNLDSKLVIGIILFFYAVSLYVSYTYSKSTPIVINLVTDGIILAVVLYGIKKKIFDFDVPCIKETTVTKEQPLSIRSIPWLINYGGSLGAITFSVSWLYVFIYENSSIVQAILMSSLIFILISSLFWLASYAFKKGSKFFTNIVLLISILGVIFYLGSIIISLIDKNLANELYLLVMERNDYGLIAGSAINGVLMAWFVYVILKFKKSMINVEKDYKSIVEKDSRLKKYIQIQKYFSLVISIALILTIIFSIPSSQVINMVASVCALLLLGMSLAYIVIESVINITLNKIK